MHEHIQRIEPARNTRLKTQKPNVLLDAQVRCQTVEVEKVRVGDWMMIRRGDSYHQRSEGAGLRAKSRQRLKPVAMPLLGGATAQAAYHELILGEAQLTSDCLPVSRTGPEARQVNPGMNHSHPVPSGPPSPAARGELGVRHHHGGEGRGVSEVLA
jgi:hypothetical protein